jgi:hypothetical protein
LHGRPITHHHTAVRDSVLFQMLDDIGIHFERFLPNLQGTRGGV